MLWDISMVRPANGPRLHVMLATILSTNEQLVEKVDATEKAGDAILDQIRNDVAQEHKDQMNQQEQEIMRIRVENEKLRKEQKNIETEIKKPNDKTIKSSAENQELEMAKDYYLSKNIEIEKLIEQVMSGSFEPPQ